MQNLSEVVQSIVSKSTELKNKYTDASTAPVEFGCIFCQSEKEYKKFTDEIEKLGQIVEETPSGLTYLLVTPVETVAGPLRLVKIRKPDFRQERGDADFNTDYKKFKKIYQKDPKFELVTYKTFEMLLISDPAFDVMACFSNIPKSKLLGIKL